jgi:DNA repair exonuclease SbcCD ATPase subunit
MAWDGAEARGAWPAPDGAGDYAASAGPILDRLDALAALIARRESEAASALDRRLAALEEALAIQGLHVATEPAALRGAMQARLDALESDWTLRLAEIEDHSEARIDLQDRRIEALLAERDRLDGALAGQAARLDLREAEGEVLADLARRLAETERRAAAGVRRAAEASAESGRLDAALRMDAEALAARVARLESGSPDADLVAGALAACAERLGEVSRQIEEMALDRLPADGVLGGALAALAAQMAAIEERLGALASITPSPQSDAFRAALAEAGAPDSEQPAA